MTLRGGELVFHEGPVFTNLLLADEINRTPPKTQAALLEAMQERQVSVEGRPRPLPDPFLVVATQNPIEYEGTYPLPEAQLDRFLVKVDVGYPAEADELAMLGLAALGRRARPAGGRAARSPRAEALRAARAGVDATRVTDEVAALPRRRRPPHPRAAERHARRLAARRDAPARRRQGGSPAGRPRLRHARRRLAHGACRCSPTASC